jgi:hypothetical protein
MLSRGPYSYSFLYLTAYIGNTWLPRPACSARNLLARPCLASHPLCRCRLQCANMEEQSGRPGQPARRHPRHHHLHRSQRQVLQAEGVRPGNAAGQVRRTKACFSAGLTVHTLAGATLELFAGLLFDIQYQMQGPASGWVLRTPRRATPPSALPGLCQLGSVATCSSCTCSSCTWLPPPCLLAAAPDTHTPRCRARRPRGWHMEEKHLLVDGEACSASLFDFAMFFYHNVHALRRNGLGPYFYLPKMESHLEARWAAWPGPQ